MTAPARQVDVLIIGAGPAGAAAGTLLARRGLSVLVVDRARFPREKPCSEFMAPDAARILDRLGALAALERSGSVALRGTSVTGPMGARLAGEFARAPGAPWRATGLAVPRRLLDATLVGVARTAGAEVLEGTTLGALRWSGANVSGATLRTLRGEIMPVTARLTIGADGLRTRVGRALGPRRHGVPRRVAFVAHVAGVDGLADAAEMHVSREGYVGLNPLGGGVANVALVVPAREAGGARGRAAEFFFERLARFGALADRIPRNGLVRAVLVTGPFAARSARCTAPGAALVGDAAEFFDPFTGEGIWTALRGAELLDDTIGTALAVGAPAEGRALAAYRAARWRTFAGQWALERLIGWGMALPVLFDGTVARLGRRPGMADTLIGVTGAVTPARAVLNPAFLLRMMV